MRTQSEITSCKFGAAKVPVSMASSVFQTFVVIEFLLHNSYPVVCSVVLCQAGSLFSVPALLFFDTLKDSEGHFNNTKKKFAVESACATYVRTVD